MIIGIIYTAYNTEDYISMSLNPWVQARNKIGSDGKTLNLFHNHQFLICGVSVPFKGFDIGAIDNTVKILSDARTDNKIDHLITSEEPMTEVDARGQALKYLVGRGADIIWQFDSDEEITLNDIDKIIKFIELNKFTTWFRVSYKNLVFTPNQYLAQPFTPPRIHRVNIGFQLKAEGFWDDNNVYYENSLGAKRDLDFPYSLIPHNVAFLRHWTWLNDERSKKKIDYQLNGRKWPSCSFRWDSEKGLCFNEEYYKSRGEPLPKVISE